MLLLFPYHIFMIYNSFGESFYIKGVDIKATTTFIFVSWPWFMPLLFTIAGISAFYAVQKKGVGAYVRGRVSKLLVPLAAGILLVIPPQTYFAERFHNGYAGGYFAQYVLFFTKRTDLSGYSGGFTPGHLWFILYLFVISRVAASIILLDKRFKLSFNRIPSPVIPALFIMPLVGSLVLDIYGKSFGEYFAYFMLGYLLLSDENIQLKLEKRRFTLLGVASFCMGVLVLGWYDALRLPVLYYAVFSRFYAWVMIMALLGLGRKYLDMSNGFTGYMSLSSFAVYVFHQTWIVASAYYVFMYTDNAAIQMALILLFSVLATFITYEICRRTRLTRFLFAVKK